MEAGGVNSTILSPGMSHKKAPLIIWMILQNPDIILPRTALDKSVPGKIPYRQVPVELGLLLVGHSPLLFIERCIVSNVQSK